jgi:O-antigen/teichoic acid export membrane protein
MDEFTKPAGGGEPGPPPAEPRPTGVPDLATGDIGGPAGSAAAQVAAASAWGLSGRTVLLVANLLATPFTIRLLGPSRYGLWALLQLSLGWAVLADVGMGSASTKFGSERYARGDARGESAVVWTALSLTFVSTSCMAVLVAIEAPTILRHLLDVRGSLLTPGIIALRVVCGMFVAQSVAGTVNVPQEVRLLWKQYTLINITANLIVSIGTPVALALMMGGVVTAAVVALCATAGGALINFLWALKLQPALRRPRVSRVVLRKLMGFGGALTVATLAAIILSSAERLFLAHTHSTTVVAYYAVAATVGTTLNVLPEQLVGPLLPGLTRLAAQGRIEEHHALYRKSLTGLFLVLTPIAILLAFMAHPFLSLWAGPAYGVHSTAPFMAIVAGVWFSCLAWVPGYYLLSSGRTKYIAYTQVGLLLPYLPVAYLLTDHLGALGAGLATASGSVVGALIFFALVWQVARLPFSPLSDRRLLSVLAPLALGGAALAASTVAHGFIVRTAWSAGFFLGYALLVWAVVLSPSERRGIRRLMAEVRRRRPAPRYSAHAA